jgi:hypothetical protein
MFQLARFTPALVSFSLGIAFLPGQPAKAQSSNLALGDPFSLVFVASSTAGAAASHNPSTLIFGTPGFLDPLFSNFPRLTVITNQSPANASSYNLDLVVTTDSNAGFIPPRITLGGQAINLWAVDLGNIFFNVRNGLNFQTPVTYNSALGTWLDNGNPVITLNYLDAVNSNSTPTQLLGQFRLSAASGVDLGAIGTGIDTFRLRVNVTPTPEPSSIFGLLALGMLGVRLLWGSQK